jgi:tRNA A-37 threonylcarbamoyl transferase component Bud32
METGTILKAGNSATVVKIKVADRILVIKRYNLKSRFHAFSRALRPTRAIISWRNANRLKLMGIPTPQPLAFIEERRGPIRRRAYFIMAYVSGEPIAEVIQKNMDNVEVLGACADHLQQLMGQLHRIRLSHGDLKAGNLLLKDAGLHILDLDGMRKHRSKGKFERAFRKDVRRLLSNWHDNAFFSELLVSGLRDVLGEI